MEYDEKEHFTSVLLGIDSIHIIGRMPDPELAKRLEIWRGGLRAKTDEELIECLNREVDNSGWVELRAYYLRELRNELDRRGFDRSAVDRPFPGKRPFALIGKALVYA